MNEALRQKLLSLPLFRYLFAVLTVLIAWVAAYLLQIVAPHLPLSIAFFVAAVAVSAGYGGIGPGILATILSAGVSDYFFLPPLYSLLLTRHGLPLLLFFLLVAFCINLLGERLQAEARVLTAVRDQLEALNGITAAMNASLELSTVLATLKSQIIRYMQIPGGLIFVFTTREEQHLLRIEESWGCQANEGAFYESWLNEIRMQEPVEETLLLKTGRISDIADLKAQPESHRSAYQHYLSLPLIANGTIQGFLCLLDTSPLLTARRGHSFMEALGLQVGVLIHNAQLYEQVRAGNARLQHLSRQLVKVQEEERREIARELHDEIGQALTGLKLGLEMGAKRPDNVAGTSLSHALSLVNGLIAQVRNLSLDLRPAMLDDLGLLPTLLWHFERYTTSTQVQVHFEHKGIEQRFSYEIETTVYRVVQEALTNVARYAQARDVTVRLLHVQDLLVVQVTDQGCGFEVGSTLTLANTGGLAGMRERVVLVGGELTIESTPGNGTCLTAELPVPSSLQELANV